MPLDFGLLGETPRINTPFQALSQILQVRQQQESARGLAEQRQAIAEQRRAQTDALQRDAEREARLTALFSTNPKPTRADIMKADPSENGQKIATAIDALQDADLKRYKDQRAVTKEAIAGLNALPENMRPNGYGAIRQTFIARGWATPEDIPESYDPTYVAGIQKSMLSAEKQYDIDNPKPTQIGTQLVKPKADGSYEAVYTAPEKPEKVTYSAPVEYLVGGRKSVVRPGSDGRMYSLDLKPLAAASIAPLPTGAGQPERPSVWVSKDGDMRYVTPNTAAQLSSQGWKPGNTREQGRPVTSGDAGRIADIDEALKLAGGLDFKKGDTGIMPYLGSIAPDAVTNLTGFGLEAKKRQGVINLVKQIIGKGLEGGVLRKEDEHKYEKILPTLSDPDEVVEAKIVMMKKTMEQKRSTFLDNLADAGYDTTKQNARGAANGGGKPPTNETPEHRVWRVGGKIGPEPK